MKKHLLTMLALVALVGCNKENLNIPVGPTDNVYTISAAPFENEIGNAATKSANYSESAQKVTNLNIWVYNNSTGALVNNATGYQTYFTNKTEIDGDLLFPDMDTKYDIYMFTNVGQITPPANKAAAAAYKYTFSSYDSFKSAGFPMAAHYCFVPSDPSQSHSLTVQRLVSKYNVTFNFSGGNNYKFTLKSAKVCKSAKVISPFANESKASSLSEIFTEADYLSTSELSAKGGELYLLENIQGNVFPSGAERSEKNILYTAKDVTSYLQFEGELDKNDGTGYHKVTCRYYFGTGTYAGVQRNYNVPLTLTMTNSILDHDDWVVTPEDPYNTGYVVFSPSSLSIVGDGNWNAFSAQTKSAEGNNENVKFKLSYNSSDWSSAGLTLQYRKGTSGSWSTYSGQELTGSYNFQIKSTYTGSTQKTVKINAALTASEPNNLSNSISITVANGTGDYSVLPAKLQNISFSSYITTGSTAIINGSLQLYSIKTNSVLRYDSDYVVTGVNCANINEDQPEVYWNPSSSNPSTLQFGFQSHDYDGSGTVDIYITVRFLDGTSSVVDFCIRNKQQFYPNAPIVSWSYSQTPNAYLPSGPFAVNDYYSTIRTTMTVNPSSAKFCVISKPECYSRNLINISPLICTGNQQISLSAGLGANASAYWCPLYIYTLDGKLLGTAGCSVQRNYQPDAECFNVTVTKSTYISARSAQCKFVVTENGCDPTGYLFPDYDFRIDEALIKIKDGSNTIYRDADINIDASTGEIWIGYQCQDITLTLSNVLGWHLEAEGGRLDADFR